MTFSTKQKNTDSLGSGMPNTTVDIKKKSYRLENLLNLYELLINY